MQNHRDVINSLGLVVLTAISASLCSCGDDDDDDDLLPDAGDGGTTVLDSGIEGGGGGDGGDGGDSSTTASTCCEFDARDVYKNSNGDTIETIIAKGKYYRTTTSGSTVTNDPDYGKDLTEIERFMNLDGTAGPCSGLAAGTCVIDAYSTHVDSTNNDQAEWVVAYGKYWIFVYDLDAPGSGPTVGSGSGSDLTTVERFSASTGPCYGLTGSTCKFDTLTMITDGSSRTQSVTAYGKYFNFTAPLGSSTWTAISSNGSNLTDVFRYKGGPCSGNTGAGCKFGSRAVVVTDQTTQTRIESISTGGKYYNFYKGAYGWAMTGAADNGTLLSVPTKYQAICAGSNDALCTGPTPSCTGATIGCSGGTNSCCAAGQACIGDTTCCATGSVCGSGCGCGAGTCTNGQCSASCGEPQLCNNASCCPASDTCLVNSCCLTSKVCGSACCGDNQNCADSNTSLCCNMNQTLCEWGVNEQSCCSNTQFCNPSTGCENPGTNMCEGNEPYVHFVDCTPSNPPDLCCDSPSDKCNGAACSPPDANDSSCCSGHCDINGLCN